MPSRVAEVIYKLKDLFSGQVKKVSQAYQDIRKESSKSASAVERDNRRLGRSVGSLLTAVKNLRAGWLALIAAVLKVTQSAKRAFNEFTSGGDRIAKMSRRLGVAVEELSNLGRAAERSGVSAQQFEVAMQRLIRKTGDAATGLGEAQQAFARFGIDAKAFAELGLEDKFLKLAAAFQAIGDDERGLSALQKLVDSEGLAIVPFLKEGPAGIRALLAEIKGIGQTFDSRGTAAAERFNNQLSRIGEHAESAKFKALTPVLEKINQALDAIDGVDTLEELQEDLRDLEDQISAAGSFGSIYFNFKAANEEAERLRARIDEIKKARQAAAEQAADEIEAARLTQQEYRQVESALQSLEATQKRRIEVLRSQLSRETDDLRRARQEQLSIEEEFKRLREDVGRDDDQEVSLTDVSLKQRQAAAALERGEAEKAIDLSRQGAKLLRKLKADGEEAQLHLNFFAKALEGTATAAGRSNVEKELLDAEKVKSQVDVAVGHMADLTAKMKEEGGRAGRAYVDEMTQVMGRATLPAPRIEPLRPVPDVVAEGIEHLRREVERRGGK